MSLALTICELVAAWGVVAGAMLWGVLRIARRHRYPHVSATVEKRVRSAPAGKFDCGAT